MGWIAHDAIVVTGFCREDIDKARAKAIEIGLPVSEAVASPMNGYYSFLIAPDGSKEGWSESDKGNDQRAAWTAWARDAFLTDRVFVSFAHVRYGETPAHIVTANGEYEDE